MAYNDVLPSPCNHRQPVPRWHLQKGRIQHLICPTCGAILAISPIDIVSVPHRRRIGLGIRGFAVTQAILDEVGYSEALSNPHRLITLADVENSMAIRKNLLSISTLKKGDRK